MPLALDEIKRSRFDLVKARLLREAADMLVISSVHLIMRALELAQDLAKDNVGAAVRHCSTIKPFDEPAIAKAVRFKHRRVEVDANN